MDNHRDLYNCNHHHVIDESHQQFVDFGDGPFVADIKAIPLLKALHEVGLKTRTHHIDSKGGFFSILLDAARLEIRRVYERDANRTKYNGKYEMLISWNYDNEKNNE